MIVVSCICILVAVIAVIAIIIVTNQQSYRILLVRIEESVKNIEYYLEKKEENLEKAIPVIKDSKKKYAKREIMDSLIKSKNIKQSLFEKDETLKDNLREFKELLEDDEKLLKVKEISEIYFESIEIENDLNASKKYYNKIVDKMDKEFKQFPKRILKGILKYEKLDKFNIKKEETLAILKEEQK